MSDTIFALATAAGRAALAVVRVSGSEAAAVIQGLGCTAPTPRVASLRTLLDPVSRETLDEALVLFMPAPRSFTGEDVVELHVHGGVAVVAGVLEALSTLGHRPAEPGEFTRRAFDNGRLDLMEAEAIADLVDADSSAQRRQALVQLKGGMTSRAEQWRSELIQALASLEAAIDFPDEDLPEQVAERASLPLTRLHQDLAEAAADLRGEKVREGYKVALVGAPNAGKSSLLNALLMREVAIVTDIAGTTRDVIEQPMELAGYRLLLADTAGIRSAADLIEVEGVRRARAWAEAADLRLWVVDGADGQGHWREAATIVRQGDILVLSKSDRCAASDAAEAKDYADVLEIEPIDASTVEPGGMIELLAALERRAIRDLGGVAPGATRIRHRLKLAEAADHLARALAVDGGQPELMAENVRLAARSIDGLTGRIDTEAVLGAVFSNFCIGK